MTEIKVVREDEKATAILKAIRQIDDGEEPETVVRCGECKYSFEYQPQGSCRVPISCENENAPWYTTEHAIFVEENFYCKYGERRADDERKEKPQRTC